MKESAGKLIVNSNGVVVSLITRVQNIEYPNFFPVGSVYGPPLGPPLFSIITSLPVSICVDEEMEESLFVEIWHAHKARKHVRKKKSNRMLVSYKSGC